MFHSLLFVYGIFSASHSASASFEGSSRAFCFQYRKCLNWLDRFVGFSRFVGFCGVIIVDKAKFLDVFDARSSEILLLDAPNVYSPSQVFGMVEQV